MSSLHMHHPDDGLLLRYIDGELPARKVRQVARHLEACWQCRTEVEDLQGTVADCVRYRKNVLETHLPAPPNQWPDLSRAFDRIDAELSQEPWMARIRRSFGSPAARRWGVAVAAAALVLAVVVQQFRETPSVEAATLLKRAVLAADARPVAERRIQIRTRNRQTTRVIGGHRPTAVMDASTASLQARFDGAHYDFEDPLSAKAYQSWRDGSANPQDEVVTVADPESPAGSCYRIRTAVADGSLANASLTLRATDLRPLEGKLEFRDGEWVEFTEITDAASPEAGRPLATNGGLPPIARAEANGPTATASETMTMASVSDELQVLSALHEIGADLGDPVDVTRSGGRVLVSGVGISPQRQKQIHGLLDAIPHVEIQFREPAATALPAEPTPPDTVPSSAQPAEIQTRMEQQVGGRAQFQRLSSAVLDRNESMMSRAFALRLLARRFPVDAEKNLSLRERQVLRDMAREHANALAREASGMERDLSPILAALGGTAAARQPAVQTAWEPAAEELWRAAHRVELLVSSMLGAAPGDGSGGRLPSDLLSAIRELRADLDQYQPLLDQ